MRTGISEETVIGWIRLKRIVTVREERIERWIDERIRRRGPILRVGKQNSGRLAKGVRRSGDGRFGIRTHRGAADILVTFAGVGGVVREQVCPALLRASPDLRGQNAGHREQETQTNHEG